MAIRDGWLLIDLRTHVVDAYSNEYWVPAKSWRHEGGFSHVILLQFKRSVSDREAYVFFFSKLSAA
jgi:hypothetical protein